MMKRLSVAIALFATLVLAACEPTEPEVNVPRYLGEPNGDDAAIIGTLAIDDANCLVVRHDDGSSTLLAIPSVASRWDADGQALVLGADRLRLGELVVVGGSGHSIRSDWTRWSTPPTQACLGERSMVWYASDGGSLVRDQPHFYTPTPRNPWDPTPTPIRALTYREALERDAATYAASAGVSLEEAMAILQRQAPPPQQNSR